MAVAELDVLVVGVATLVNPLGMGYRVTDKISGMSPNAKGDAFAICGHYCGPGHPKNTATTVKPTDGLNAACRAHDACIRRQGFACSCDQDLTNAILKGRTRLQLSKIEGAIVTYFAASPCDKGCKRVGQYVGDKNGYQVCRGSSLKQVGLKKPKMKLPNIKLPKIPGFKLPKW